MYNPYQEDEYREDLIEYFQDQLQNSSNEQQPASFQNETLLVGGSSAMHWQCVEYRLSLSEIEQIQAFAFWIEGVCQLALVVVGIISNLLAIPILCSSKMKSIFNRLLICLLSLHTVYLICVILSEIMWPAWDDNPQSLSKVWFIFSFSYVLHPLRQLMRYSSTYFTALMARQRYLAIRHPI